MPQLSKKKRAMKERNAWKARKRAMMLRERKANPLLHSEQSTETETETKENDPSSSVQSIPEVQLNIPPPPEPQKVVYYNYKLKKANPIKIPEITLEGNCIFCHLDLQETQSIVSQSMVTDLMYEFREVIIDSVRDDRRHSEKRIARSYIHDSKFCNSCLEIVSDIHFLQSSISGMKKRLDAAKEKIQCLLLKNSDYIFDRKISCKARIMEDYKQSLAELTNYYIPSSKFLPNKIYYALNDCLNRYKIRKKKKKQVYSETEIKSKNPITTIPQEEEFLRENVDFEFDQTQQGDIEMEDVKEVIPNIISNQDKVEVGNGNKRDENNENEMEEIQPKVAINYHCAHLYCEFTTTTMRKLNCHQKKHKPKYTCVYCKLKFDYKNKLDDHMTDNHPDSSYVKSLLSQPKFQMLITSNNSSLKPKTPKPIKPKKPKPIKPKKPKPIIQSLEKFYCSICKNVLLTTTDLEVHELLHKNNTTNPYACVLCSEIFNTAIFLQDHVRKTHNSGPNKCDKCGKGYFYEYNLRTHFITCKRTRVDLQCPTCGFQAPHQAYLKRHIMTTHEEGFNALCETCGKKFKVKQALDVHVRMVHGKRKAPFNCELCGKGFSRGESLKDHVRCHGTERPFKCNLCAHAFKTQKHLKQHLRVHALKKDTKSFRHSNPRKGRLPPIQNPITNTTTEPQPPPVNTNNVTANTTTEPPVVSTNCPEAPSIIDMQQVLDLLNFS